MEEITQVKYKLFDKQFAAYNFRKQFCAVIAGVQCYFEDEYVYAPDGIIQAKDIADKNKILGGKVSGRYSFDDDIYEIRFSNGIKIRTNSKHPFYCKTPNGGQWLPLQDIKAKKDKIFFYSAENQKIEKHPIKLAKVLGYLTSDGHDGKGQSIKFTNTNFHFIDEVRKLCKILSDIHPRLYKKGKGWDLFLTTIQGSRKNLLKDYIRELGITKNSFGKILQGDKDSLIEFLRGYFNGNGYLTVYKNRKGNRKDTYIIGFCVGISERKAYELQYILWKLGIRSHIRKEWFKKSTQNFYRVVVDRNSSEQLLHQLDWSKYPDKFYKASLIKTLNIKNNTEWISVSSIKKVGRGKVIGWETTTHEIISYCGMKTHNSGKTHLGSIWAMKKTNEYPTKDGLIVAPSYKILQQSTLRKFFTLFPQYRALYREQRSVIELPPGGTVFIRSMDKPLGAEGTTASWIWADELGQSPVMAWTILRSRVAMTGGQILITTTPYNMGWLYQEFYLPWKRGEDESLTVYSWKSIENPWFPKETYEAERKRLSPEEFARRYMGEFSKPHGLVYGDFNESHIISPRKIDGYTIAGVDFGYTNPAAIIVLRYSFEDKNWYVIDEWYETQRTQDEINVAAIALQKQYNIRKFFPDSAEPDRIQMMRNVGLTCYEVNKDVVAGINKVRELIRFNQFFVFDTCHNTIDELANYHYAEKKEANREEPVTLEAPVKEYDHALDAIRMALYSDCPIGGRKSAEETRFSKKMKEKNKSQKQTSRIRGY